MNESNILLILMNRLFLFFFNSLELNELVTRQGEKASDVAWRSISLLAELNSWEGCLNGEKSLRDTNNSTVLPKGIFSGVNVQFKNGYK